MPHANSILTTFLVASTLGALFAGCEKPAEIAPTAASEPAPVEAPETPPTPESTPTVSPDAPPAESNVDSTWLIVPGKSVGKINAETSEFDLVELYGAENVRDDEFHVGEGEMIPCTVVFPDDDTKRVQVLWENPEKLEHPTTVSIDSPGSIWKTAAGLGVGTSLKTVEELNGKPFSLYGFEWDYGGRISNLDGGALDTPSGALQIEFQPDYESALPNFNELLSEVSGDTEFPSSHPTMQTINPKVYSIAVRLGDAKP